MTINAPVGEPAGKVILLIQDDAAAAALVTAALVHSPYCHFEVEWLRRCDEGVQRLSDVSARPPVAAVLAALRLPDSDGIATFDRLHDAAPLLPMLLFALPQEEAIASLAVQRGAQDYLLPDQLQGAALPRTVRSMIERAAIAATLHRDKEHAQLTLNSIGDAVITTDLLGNITYLNAVAERRTGWTAADAIGTTLERVFCIVDAANRDPARDRVLVRRDGHEAAIEDVATPLYDRAGAVIGAVTVFHDVSEARALAQQRADLATYHATAGGDTGQFSIVELNELATERHAFETALRLALRNEEFVLHYQPRISIDREEITGVEALIRWHRPHHGLVPPSQFIPVAEQTGLIVPIGQWVLQQACLQGRAWADAGLPELQIAVNVSAVELRQADFASFVQATLLRTGIRPELLELEITETFVMQDEKATDATLRALRAMGVRLALDDFGTGYSSLTYVKRLPITTLKIDLSFVASLGGLDVADDASMVSAVISMGKALHIGVVAEGVETAEQLAFLKQHGCPEAQGYYFSPPVDQGAIARLISRNRVDETARLKALISALS